MEQLILLLLQNGIYLSREGDKLNVEYNGDVIPDELLSEIRANKDELLKYLSLEKDNSVYKDIVPVKDAESFNLSSAQLRLWILSQLGNGLVAYNMPSYVNLNQDIDIDCFKRAIEATIERHEILRTVFKKDAAGEVKQYILKKADLGFTIDYKDFRGEQDKDEKVKQYIADDVYQPFDFEKGPLLRASLLQVENEAYVFYYNLHHIIGDGWSMEVLSRDVFKYYEAYKENRKPELNPLRIQYKDYSAWQLTQLETETLKNHKAYWLENLKGDLPLIDFPSTKNRPRIKTYDGLSLHTYIDKEVSRKLKKYSQENGGSLFMGLLAAWNVLVYHYTSQTDTVIGTAVAGRSHADLEDQIGFYVNLMPLRNQLNPEESFAVFYKALTTKTFESYSHQVYPFDKLVEELNSQRNVSRNAVFDVMLSLQNIGQNGDGNELNKDELNQIVNQGYHSSKYDIELLAQEEGDYLSLKVVFNTEVYEQRMIEALINNYKRILQVVYENPEAKIAQLDYLTLEEKNKLQVVFNETKQTFPTNRMLVDLFEEQAQKTPHAIAIICEEREWSYRELEEHSNQLAHYLQETHAIKSDVLVGILQERSEWMMVSILAVWKAGGAYIPLNPNDPTERIKQLVSSSNLNIVLTNGTILEELGALIINLEEVRGSLSDLSVKALKTVVDPHSLSYVIYTSGSTGKPKGVMIEHFGMINHIGSKIKEMWIDSKSKVAQNAPHTFDISVWQFFSALIVGGSTIIYSQETILDPSAFIKQVDADKITTLELVPSYLLEMLTVLETNPQRISFSALKILILNAETLTPSMVKRWLALYPHIPIVNTYGATEASDDVCHYIMYECPTTITIPVLKRPIQNFQINIVDAYLNLVPVGVKGEIILSGPAIGRGYLNDEIQTQKSFLKGPLPGVSNHQRIYRTGDLGCYLEDGTMEFLGRKDSQVKINGHRIELGEIEHALRSHKDVEESVVLDRENAANTRVLVAYFLAKVDLNINDLRSWLKAMLPEYMLPTHYIQMETFPLTPNGKINKKGLPNPKEMDLVNEIEYVAPTNPIEEKLVKIWEEILGREKVGIKDSFFSLGGHSLKIIKVINEVNKQFDVKYDLKRLFADPTIESMSEQIKTDIWFKDSKIENEDNYNEIKI